jgi:hypothetical protein
MPYYSQIERIPTLLEALNQHTVDVLKKLAGLLPGGKSPTRKAELVDYIHQSLEGSTLMRLWGQCDRLQQAAIAETVHSTTSDRYEKIRFVSKYHESPSWGTARYAYGSDFKPTALDLFFYNSIMPQDLKQRLRGFVPPPISTQIASQETIAATLSVTRMKFDRETRTRIPYEVEFPLQLRETEQVARRELLTVLRLVDLGKIAVSDKTFNPSTATLKAIEQVLEEGDYYSEWTLTKSPEGWRYIYSIGYIKPFAWVMLLQAGKLVELSGKNLRLTKAGQKALIEPAEKTLQIIWKSWQKTNLFDELRRVDGIKGQTGKGKRSLTAVPGRRTQIVAALKDCPVGQWIRINEFFRYILAAGYDLVVCRSLEHFTINGESGSYYDTNFNIVEARYIICCLFEYIATLGMIDVSFLHPDDGGVANFKNDGNDYYIDSALSSYDGLAYFRITPLGAYLLGISDRYIPKELPQKQILRILPNLEVVAVQELARADRLMLDSSLQSVSDSVWKFDRGKLLESIAQGRSVDELKTFLVANSGEVLPQTAIQFLADLQTRTTSLEDLGAARLIRCVDPALAVLIANDTRTKAFCFLADRPTAMMAAAAGYLVVPTETETKFRNALKKIGYSLPN